MAARWGLFDTAYPEELLQLAGRLKDASAKTGSEHLQTEALVAMVVDLLRVGQLHAAQTAIAEHREHARRNHRRISRYLQRTFDTMMALWEGRFRDAEDEIGKIRAEMLRSGRILPPGSEGTVLQSVVGQTGWLFRELGQESRLTAQEQDVTEMIRQAGHIPVWRAALALLYCETGNHQQASDIVAEIAQEHDSFRAFPPHGWAVPTLFLLAEVCSELHSATVAAVGGLPLASTAGRLSDRLERHLSEFALAGTPSVLLGPVSRAAGLAKFVAGEAAAALPLLNRASHEATPSAQPTQARLHLDRARVYLADGSQNDREKAAHQLERALNLASALRMDLLVKQAQALRV